MQFWFQIGTPQKNRSPHHIFHGKVWNLLCWYMVPRKSRNARKCHESETMWILWHFQGQACMAQICLKGSPKVSIITQKNSGHEYACQKKCVFSSSSPHFIYLCQPAVPSHFGFYPEKKQFLDCSPNKQTQSVIRFEIQTPPAVQLLGSRYKQLHLLAVVLIWNLGNLESDFKESELFTSSDFLDLFQP